MSEICCQTESSERPPLHQHTLTHHRDIEGTGETGEDVLAGGGVGTEEVGDRLGGDDRGKEGSDV
jgi:hypothetical protein